MDVTTKIRMAEAALAISEAELVRRMGGTPLGKSSQAFGQRMKTGKFTTAELEQIAEAMGAKYVCYFEFPDGTRI